MTARRTARRCGLDPAHPAPLSAGPVRRATRRARHAARAAVLLAALAAAWVPAGCGGEADEAPVPGPAEEGGAADRRTDAPTASEALRERIRSLAREGTQARQRIEPFLAHAHPAAREEAAVVYPRVAEGTAAPALARLATDDPEPDVRAAAVTAIGHMRAMDEMDAILRALADPDALVRRRAAEAASRITGQRYDVDVSPEAWRRTVEEIRTLWQNHGATLRAYHKRRTSSGRR